MILERPFFFGSVDPRQYAALRILFGLFALHTLIMHLPEAPFLLSASGWSPMDWHAFTSNWSLFYFFTSTSSARAVLIFGIACAAAMTVGWKSRVSIWLTFVVIGSVVSRHHLWYGYYGILRIVLFYLGFCEAGQAWSIDKLLDSTHPKVASAWPLRLIQIQIALIYFCSGFAKFHGIDWIDGTAVARILLYYCGPIMDFLRPEIHPITRYVLMASNYLTMAWEVGFPFLMLTRWTRLPALVFGVVFHVAIMAVMGLWGFSLVMIACYVAYLPEGVLAHVEKFSTLTFPRTLRLSPKLSH